MEKMSRNTSADRPTNKMTGGRIVLNLYDQSTKSVGLKRGNKMKIQSDIAKFYCHKNPK